MCPAAAMSRASGTLGPEDKWVQIVLLFLHRVMATSTMLGFRCFTPAQLHSYQGKTNIHSNSNCLLQDILSTESPKSGRGLRKVSLKGSWGLCWPVPGCRAAQEPSCLELGQAQQITSPGCYTQHQSEETLLSTALIKLLTHCL